MATLSVQNMVDAGTEPTFGSATASDRADVGSGVNTYIHYKNSSGSPVVVNVKGSGNTTYGVAKPDNVVTVPATGSARIPLRKEYDQGDGLGAMITTTGSASLTVAVVRFS